MMCGLYRLVLSHYLDSRRPFPPWLVRHARHCAECGAVAACDRTLSLSPQARGSPTPDRGFTRRVLRSLSDPGGRERFRWTRPRAHRLWIPAGALAAVLLLWVALPRRNLQTPPPCAGLSSDGDRPAALPLNEPHGPVFPWPIIPVPLHETADRVMAQEMERIKADAAAAARVIQSWLAIPDWETRQG